MSTADLSPTVVLVHGEQATGTYVDAALFHDAVCAEAPADVAAVIVRAVKAVG